MVIGGMEILGHTWIRNDGEGNTTVQYAGDPLFEPLLEDPYEKLKRPPRSVPCDPPASLLQEKGDIPISKIIRELYVCLCNLEMYLSKKWDPIVQTASDGVIVGRRDAQVPDFEDISGAYYFRCELKRLFEKPFDLPPFKHCVDYGSFLTKQNYGTIITWSLMPSIRVRQEMFERESENIPCFESVAQIALHDLLTYHETIKELPKQDMVYSMDPPRYTLAEDFLTVPKYSTVNETVFSANNPMETLGALKEIKVHTRLPNYMGYTYEDEKITIYTADTDVNDFAPRIPSNEPSQTMYGFVRTKGFHVIEE